MRTDRARGNVRYYIEKYWPRDNVPEPVLSMYVWVSTVCVSPHSEDLLEAVIRRRRKTQNAEVADEAWGHRIASPSWRSTRCSNGHFLEDRKKGERVDYFPQKTMIDLVNKMSENSTSPP